MANVYLALEQDLAIVAVINKIDLPSADPEKVAAGSRPVHRPARRRDRSRIRKDRRRHRRDPGSGRAPHASAARTIRRAPARALIFDSHYDPYKGVIAYVKIVDGAIAAGDRIG